MANVIDETWIANVEWPIALVELSTDREEVVATLDAPHSTRDIDRARARLAAQAPAMARLLVDLEWGGSGFRDDGAVRTHWKACPRCFAHKGTSHADDCGIAAVLRAAGVLP